MSACCIATQGQQYRIITHALKQRDARRCRHSSRRGFLGPGFEEASSVSAHDSVDSVHPAAVRRTIDSVSM
jgi:hypothetical protein